MSEQPDSVIETPTAPDDAIDPATDDATGLQHVTVDEGEIAVCTMFPRDPDADEMSAKWLTASGESFVSLVSAR